VSYEKGWHPMLQEAYSLSPVAIAYLVGAMNMRRKDVNTEVSQRCVKDT